MLFEKLIGGNIIILCEKTIKFAVELDYYMHT